MDTTSVNSTAVSLSDVVSTAIQLPGVRVNRYSFLCDAFKEVDKDSLQSIIEKGPVEAGVGRGVLKQKAHKLIQSRTAISTGASFAAGLPGGLAMAATIPADMLQFYGVSLRMAQELAYLYGETDLWEKDLLDRDKVTNQLILYCGVMFGATGASQSVRLLSSAMAKQAMKKLPQQALTKTFYYPVIKYDIKTPRQSNNEFLIILIRVSSTFFTARHIIYTIGPLYLEWYLFKFFHQ